MHGHKACLGATFVCFRGYPATVLAGLGV